MIFILANKLLKLLSRISSKKGYDYVAKMSDEDIVRNVGYLAHALRDIRKKGAGISMYPIKLALTQGYKTILLKEREGKKIFGFEEWIKDNFRLLIGAFSSIKASRFPSLPHCDGVPRVVILADFIVRYGGTALTEEQVRIVTDAFNAVTPLTYPEIECLADAIRYRLLFEISLFAERSISYYASEKRAKRKRASFRRVQADSFLYHYAILHAGEGENALPKEVDWEGARLGFENILADNELLLSRHVGSLRRLSDGDARYLSLSKTDGLYRRDPAYRDMSNASRKDYLAKTYEIAERLDLREEAVAQAALLLGKECGVHFGEILFRHFPELRTYLRGGRILPLQEVRATVQGGYAAIVLLLSLALAAFPTYYLRSVLSYVAVIPLFIILLHPVEYLLKRYVAPRVKSRALPQMDYEQLPETCRTIVLVSRFIGSKEGADEAMTQIETLAASFRDPAVSYVVLADFPSSDREWGEGDEELLDYIRSLKRSERVSYFVRKRTRKGSRFIGRERKRGAILDFFSAIRSRSSDGFHAVGALPEAEYAILLDDDSELLPGTIRAAVMAMAHPLNQGYDLMSFGGKINRYSLTTFYSDKFSRSCGVDAYPFYSDFYADRFDCALYCGKAIVRIDRYLEKLRDFFPDDRILSHDIIEGAVLRSTSLKRCVYEDAPSTFAGDALRASRWARGDVQLLPYAICDRVKDRTGRRVKNPIAPIYKLILFINGLSVLREFMAASLLCAAFFVGDYFLAAYVVLAFLFVYVYALVASIRTFGKIRFGEALRTFFFSLWLLAEQVILLPFRALNGIYLFVVTSLKMAFHSKNLLDWKPFRLTQGAGAFEDGARMLLPSWVAVTVLMIIAGDYRVSIYVLLYYLYGIFLILSGRSIKEKGPDAEEKKILTEQAKKIYAYFSDVREEPLIPDNLQLFPYMTRAKMTSPTNIGFAFLAEVSAAKLGLISEEEACENIKTLLDKTEALETWKGHLYNWYDVKTSAVMPPRVVSTVDSANYLACLAAVGSFLEESGKEALAERVRVRVEQADFSALYDEDKKALHIVWFTTEGRGSGHYDLLASEARLAYCFALSQGVDPECYFRLGRDLSPIFGNTLLSWSGTAFEYMLPRIFLKAPCGSLLYEQEYRSGRVQMRDRSEELFGRSECGYHEFNDAIAYRYKAIGCAKLALSGEGGKVIAPYASYLYLPLFPKPCLANLHAMRLRGAEGRYGFYEAIDFEREGNIVMSFMTHHQGMSLASIVNRVCGDEICRLFSRSPAIRCVRLFFAEEDRHEYPPKVYVEGKAVGSESSERIASPALVPEAIPFSDGEYDLILDANGRSAARIGSIRLNKFNLCKREKGGIFVQIKEGDRISSPSYYPCGDRACRAILRSDSVRYENVAENLFEEAYPLMGYEGEMRKIVIRNPSDRPREVTFSVYCDMMLNGEDAYDSHPAYSDMFVRAEYDEKHNAAYLIRRNGEGAIPIAAAMIVRGLSEVIHNENRYNVIGRGGDHRRDYEAGIKQREAPPDGDVLYPCFAFTGKAEIPPHEESVVYVALLGSRSVQTLRDRVERLDLAYRGGALDLIGREGGKDPVDPILLSHITGRLLYEQTSPSVLAACYEGRALLVKRGIDPDLPILFYPKEKVRLREEREKIAAVLLRLSKAGIRCDLVIECDRVDGAGMNSLEAAERSFRDLGVKGIVVSGEEASSIRACASIDLGIEACQDSSIEEEDLRSPDPAPHLPMDLPCGEGGFTEEGYRVIPFREHTLLPYANVVAGKEGGFVVTERGGGFTFGKNARENKLTVWSGDAVEDLRSETLVLSIGEEEYLLNASNCLHKIGSTVYSHTICGKGVRVEEYLVASGRVKVYEILLVEDPPQEARLTLSLTLALGWRFSDRIFALPEREGFTLIRSDDGAKGFVYSPDGALTLIPPTSKGDPMSFVSMKGIGKGVFRIMIGSGEREDIPIESLPTARARTMKEIFVDRIRVDTAIPALDRLYNRILSYQTMSARLNARTGFYQCGGAYGFRDQLQDVLAFLISDPDRVRERILDAAAHQYEEGDVQHWWHPPRVGVRTRISDDRLWLVYLTERYCEVTGDLAILDEEIPFLSSPPLAEGEVSRYEIPNVGGSSSLRDHLLRALRISLRYGEHGLLKMGSGDWNDGLDRVGVKGRGESVWLTMFAKKVIGDALLFFGDADRAYLRKEAQKLQDALAPLMKDGRYPLAFADDGNWLGYSDTSACTLALNPQTWSVLGECVKEEDARRALDTASALTDERYDLVKLSVPPFDLDSDYGYISAYPKGVRENGGQYTHAVVWYLKALLLAEEREKAYHVIEMLNPILRTDTKEKVMVYKGEPYVLAADIYGCEPYCGRAGWTWYTGSAGWLKYVITEDFFGIVKRGDRLTVKPRFPKRFRHLSVEIRLPDRKIFIVYERSDREGLFLNEKEIKEVSLSECGQEINLLYRFR